MKKKIGERELFRILPIWDWQKGWQWHEIDSRWERSLQKGEAKRTRNKVKKNILREKCTSGEEFSLLEGNEEEIQFYQVLRIETSREK